MALEAVLNLESLPAALNSQTLQDLVKRGRSWLKAHQNADGGWGDTTLSHSNISTTALVWAAFSEMGEEFASSLNRCEAWLQRSAGSLEPAQLARAITQRYGIDRTFSVPILTALALRNRLGANAWTLIPALPFELAAFPHAWYARLKLPVVSYALPALISIGQVQHARRPSANPFLRLARIATQRRTLNVLREIQPASGGFLEATPLTSFVVMSLVGAGFIHHDVVKNGVGFLIRSIRPDGSWPIDTNLATWVTTLSVNALSTCGPLNHSLQPAEQQAILDWLAAQQLQVEHPYTHAAPGGWAWTDLSGGVPDADDTPGALLALWNLSGTKNATAAENGIRWLLDLQNSDGGIPTFCRGWGLLPFDRSSNDLTAHALRAWAIWFPHVHSRLQQRILRGAGRAWMFLKKSQTSDGAWAPLWFGNQHADTEENLTYGTSRVLLALMTSEIAGINHLDSMQSSAAAGLRWLLAAQNQDGGWGGGGKTPSTIEETALAVEAIAASLSVVHSFELPQSAPFLDPAVLSTAVSRGLQWLADETDCGRSFTPSPIGFYFAKLWYFESMYPVVDTLAALGRAVKRREGTA